MILDFICKVQSCRITDGLIAGKGKALDFPNAEPQVFNRVFGCPIGSKAIAIGF
jgi:hypothetical protein